MNRHDFLDKWKRPFRYFPEDINGKQWRVKNVFMNDKPPTNTFLLTWPSIVTPRLVNDFVYMSWNSSSVVTISTVTFFEFYEPL